MHPALAQGLTGLSHFVGTADELFEGAFEMLAEIQPVLGIQVEALQDVREIRGDMAFFVAPDDAAGPVHQL